MRFAAEKPIAGRIGLRAPAAGSTSALRSRAQRADNAGTLERLGRFEFLAQRHQTGHFRLRNVELLAAYSASEIAFTT
ncbi:hypothetical protein GCM10011358_12540 [Sinisalibacter lacisalsi]|uniref:Uncharacterized protein n=1 Tax=Sinisalibacter lacisalsi TaxID=1526570 RepID=A0ABQ1QJH7_9RHOB|nr:hypothetical protein GCM10011358_12540 [Sinisalibacter lacisalsi]